MSALACIMPEGRWTEAERRHLTCLQPAKELYGQLCFKNPGIRNQALPAEVMESVFRDRFATWHGIASVLYLIECLLGVLLVWLQGRNPG